VLASVPLFLLVASCTGQKIEVVGPSPAAAAPQPVQPGGASQVAGFAAIAQPTFQYIFAPPSVVLGQVPAPPTVKQPSSLALQALVEGHKRLEVTPLPSTDGTVALAFVETSTVSVRWGAVMIPAERKLFARFATDASLGNWLIVIDDVKVTDGRDPVPLTAYRWPRKDVEVYSDCGIPPQFVIDKCTDAFYGASETVLLYKPGNEAGQ